MNDIRFFSSCPDEHKQRDITEMNEKIDNKFRQLDTFISLFKCKKNNQLVLNNSNFDSNIGSLIFFNQKVRDAIVKNTEKSIAITKRDITSFWEFGNRFSSVIDYIEDKSKNMLKSLKDEVKRIESEEKCSPTDQQNITNIQEIIHKLNIFKIKKFLKTNLN